MHILRYAIRNISRNIGLSSSVTLIIAFLIFFVCILRFSLFSTDAFTRYILDHLGVVVVIQGQYDGTSIRVQEAIAGIESGFDGLTVRYISREDALKNMAKNAASLAAFVETPEDNPLPNSIAISHIRDLSHYRAIDAYLSEFRDVLEYDASTADKRLIAYQQQYTRIAAVIAKLQMLKWAMYVFLALFILTVLVIVSMVIHTLIFFVQDEIRIIELVGGRPLYIYGPLALQGALYTGTASLLAIGLMQAILTAVGSSELSPYFVGFFSDFARVFHGDIWLLLLGFSCIGATSAWLASWRYIHSTIGA